MARTRKQLEGMGWRFHPLSKNEAALFDPEKMTVSKTFFRQAGETDAEFRERLERNTPGIENFDWVTALRRAKSKRVRLSQEAKDLDKEIESLTQKVREVSLWDVIAGQPPMTWWEMVDWFTNNPELKEFNAASHGNRVDFFGLKSQGRPLLAVAMRVGWHEDMEGDDE